MVSLICTACALRGDYCSQCYFNSDGQDYITPDISWKYSNHYEFGIIGDRTNELFATLLLGLQRLNDSDIFKEADSMMLEEMLENWTFADTLQIS